MSILHAIVLGLTQGLTEFFPVSSSGPLAIVPWLMGWDDFGDDHYDLTSLESGRTNPRLRFKHAYPGEVCAR